MKLSLLAKTEIEGSQTGGRMANECEITCTGFGRKFFGFAKMRACEITGIKARV